MQSKSRLRLYAADLTHSYIALASGTFPLGLAYVGSAIKKVFGDDVELELFKYSDDLDRRVRAQPPDVFFFSSYVWNANLCMEFARSVKQAFPGTLVVGGGPNLSKDPERRRAFMAANPFVDFWVMQEGEVAASYLLLKYSECGHDIQRLKEEQLPSVLTIMPDGSMKSGAYAPRLGLKAKANTETSPDSVFRSGPFVPELQWLDDIPSPYTTGLMDKFFDNKLYPLIETNRGCPFTCSFCQQGESYFNKVSARSIEHCVEEFEFLASAMTKRSPGIARVEIADPNFCMFPQDLAFCSEIRRIQDKYGWPTFIGCSTGKNKPDRILDAVSKLMPDSLVISNAMQSTNEETLVAIKRSNISLESYKKVQTEIHRRGLRSMADVILGLPLETKESHFSAIYNLIDSGVQEFTSYQAMILKSTDLELQPAQEKYGFSTKWRLLPRAIGVYSVLGRDAVIPEVEQIVVATNTLSFNEYLQARRLHLTTMIYHNSGVFQLVHQYLKQRDIPPSRLIKEISRLSFNDNSPLVNLYRDFLEETAGELFSGEKEARDFYSRRENLDRVKRGEIGGNLLWKYLAVALFEYWEQTVGVVIAAVRNLVESSEEDLRDIAAILIARVANVSLTPLVQDVPLEIRSPEVLRILKCSGYRISDGLGKVTGKMTLSEQKYKTLRHAQLVYPKNRTGWSLILSVHRVHTVTRELSV